MVRAEAGAADGAGRTRTLRREWSRAVTIMLVLLLAASIATFAGVRQLVSEISSTASQQLDRESTTVASLRASLIDHEGTAHQLLSGAPADRQAFLRQQDRISQAFHDALATFPAGSDATGTLNQAGRTWQAALTEAGLWGDQVPALQGSHEELQGGLSAGSDEARALLDGLRKPALEAMRKGLVADAGLLLAALGVLFGVALAVTLYLRRRMGREFNGLAGALHENHLALTLRATHDSVTGLANRKSLMERLVVSFTASRDRRVRKESVLSIDIDDFKDINYALGHEGGDTLLTQMSVRLKGCVRPHDLVACLGGDEFAIVVLEDDGGSAAVVIAERILKALRAPFTVSGTRRIVAVSIGVAERRPETSDATEVLRDADFAMHMAKGAGKNRYQLFDVQVHDAMVSRSALKSDLAVAVTARQLRLEYQPVADLRNGEVVGVEALVRWQHPTLGLLAPGAFIGLAEETGDIEAIGCWVLDTAARQVAGWRQKMHHCKGLWVAVNISALQFPRPESLAAIQSILADPAVQADKVVLEVTETALAADADGGFATLSSLKRFGVRIAIDDFGTRFSSLSTLAGLPVDILKIDRCFVSGQSSTSPSVPMLEGIVGLASKLSLDVIAEGIEEPEQLDLVRTLGCHMGQGFLLARPAPADVLEALLSSRGLWPSPVKSSASSNGSAVPASPPVAGTEARGPHSEALQLDAAALAVNSV